VSVLIHTLVSTKDPERSQCVGFDIGETLVAIDRYGIDPRVSLRHHVLGDLRGGVRNRHWVSESSNDPFLGHSKRELAFELNQLGADAVGQFGRQRSVIGSRPRGIENDRVAPSQDERGLSE